MNTDMQYVYYVNAHTGECERTDKIGGTLQEFDDLEFADKMNFRLTGIATAAFIFVAVVTIVWYYGPTILA